MKKNQLTLEEMLAMVYALAIIIKADSITEAIKELFNMRLEVYGNLVIVWSPKHIRADVYSKYSGELLFSAPKARLENFLKGYDSALATIEEDLNRLDQS